MKRRRFMETSAGAALAVAIPGKQMLSPVLSSRVGTKISMEPNDAFTLRDPRVKALAQTALDAARSAGANYADARATYVTSRRFDLGTPAGTDVTIGLSVRALVNGYWGWAGTPYVAMSEASRLGREAAALAKGNAARGRPRSVEWGAIPIVADGTWTTPITIDPFDLATEEIHDVLNGYLHYGLDSFAFRTQGRQGIRSLSHIGVLFAKQEQVFASTEGNYLNQTLYGIDFTWNLGTSIGKIDMSLPAAQAGWEYIQEASLRAKFDQELDKMLHGSPALPLKSHLDPGRYDIICTAGTVAQLLGGTLARATQLDRALGYEANAGGTSYLGPDPLTQLGTTVASPLITVNADRSAPKALATVRWDDDGVMPEDFTLVKDGVFVDYQTTREQAPWLAPYYTKHGRSVRSHGCAASPDALSYAMQHTPNLTMQPGPADVEIDDIVSSMDKGLLIDGMALQMDFQALNGLGYIGGQFGTIVEVRNGRRVSMYDSRTVLAGLLFHTPEFWKAVSAIGGPKSLVPLQVATSEKGEPSQRVQSSFATVPMLIQQQAIIDPTRKA